MVDFGSSALADLWLQITTLRVVLLACVGALAWLARSYYRFLAGYKKLAHIPGPPVHYPIGSAWVLAKYGRNEGWKKLTELGGDREQGIHRVVLPGLAVVMLTKKEHLRQILQVSSHHLYPGKSMGDPGSDWTMYRLGRDSVLFNDADQHDEWVRLRRILGRAFVSTAIKPLVHPIASVLDKAVDCVRSEQKRLALEGKPVDFLHICNALALDIIGKCSFSADFGALDNMIGGGKGGLVLEANDEIRQQRTWRAELKHLIPFTKPSWLWVPTKSNRRMKAAHDTLWRVIEERIALIRKAKESGGEGHATYGVVSDIPTNKTGKYRNFMELLMDASEEGRLTDLQLRSNALTIMEAGHMTTGMTLVHTMYLLAQHQDAQNRLREEVDEVWPDGTEPDESTYRKLDYTAMVIKEAQRLHPQPFLTIRSIPKAMNIGGYDFPKDTPILIHMGLAMRDARNWDDPNTFKPERFTKEAAMENFYAWLPFMHGGRTCVGQRFAQMSTSLTIAALVRRFEFTLPDDYVYEATDDDSMSVLVNGMPLFARERQKSSATVA